MPDSGRFIALFPGEVFAKVGDQFGYILISRILQYIGMKEMRTVAGFADNGAFRAEFHVADQRFIARFRLFIQPVIPVADLYILPVDLDFQVYVLLKLFGDHGNGWFVKR